MPAPRLPVPSRALSAWPGAVGTERETETPTLARSTDLAGCAVLRVLVQSAKPEADCERWVDHEAQRDRRVSLCHSLV